MQNKYLTFSKRYLTEARKNLLKKNYENASEKFWGAASQMVKAVAEKKGYKHNGHAKLFDIVEKIATELKNEEVRELFLLAHELHVNFYEHIVRPKTVRIISKKVEKFIEILQKNFFQ